jgi:hypothetical protein
MTRWPHTLLAFVLLSAWAGAQNGAPPVLTAEDKVRLFRENVTLIESLVNDGVALSAADTPVKRAEHSRSAARALVNAIAQAAGADDADRVAELAGLFRVIARDGVVPVLNDAKRVVSPESPDGKRLRELREQAARDVSDVKALAGGKLGASARVRDALKALDEVTDALK